MPHATNAIVRPPGPRFSEGLTTAALGKPDLEKALLQHRGYRAALARCGMHVVELEPLDDFPDATFVEDVAVLTPRGAILSRPGAPSRLGEVESMRSTIERYYPAPAEIAAPGTLDGGDILHVDDAFFIGISRRTNVAGAEQLARWLSSLDYSSTLVDVRSVDTLLHFTSGVAYLGDDILVAVAALAERPELCAGKQVVATAPEEDYAANCIPIADRVFVAAGFPRLAEDLSRLGVALEIIEMSEFEKMDGGLSCLSLRF